MSCKVIITDRAKDDLRKIMSDIAKISGNRETALNFVCQIKEQTKQLEQFPLSGAIPKDKFLKSLGYRFITYRDYMIFYRYEDNKVYIATVFNGKLDYFRVMRQFI